MAIGKRITEVLEEKGWKQADLLRAAPNVGQSSLSQIINRDSAVAEFLFDIADGLGVSARWLQTGIGPRDGVGPDAPWPTQVEADNLRAELTAFKQKVKQASVCLRAYTQASDEDKDHLVQLAASLLDGITD
jgi:transcriptional regulator with XRE-family HTH domain